MMDPACVQAGDAVTLASGREGIVETAPYQTERGAWYVMVALPHGVERIALNRVETVAREGQIIWQEAVWQT